MIIKKGVKKREKKEKKRIEKGKKGKKMSRSAALATSAQIVFVNGDISFCDDAAADDETILVEHERLTRGDAPNRFRKGDCGVIAFNADTGLDSGALITDAGLDIRVGCQTLTIGEAASDGAQGISQQVVAVA